MLRLGQLRTIERKYNERSTQVSVDLPSIWGKRDRFGMVIIARLRSLFSSVKLQQKQSIWRAARAVCAPRTLSCGGRLGHSLGRSTSFPISVERKTASFVNKQFFGKLRSCPTKNLPVTEWRNWACMLQCSLSDPSVVTPYPLNEAVCETADGHRCLHIGLDVTRRPSHRFGCFEVFQDRIRDWFALARHWLANAASPRLIDFRASSQPAGCRLGAK